MGANSFQTNVVVWGKIYGNAEAWTKYLTTFYLISVFYDIVLIILYVIGFSILFDKIIDKTNEVYIWNKQNKKKIDAGLLVY